MLSDNLPATSPQAGDEATSMRPVLWLVGCVALCAAFVAWAAQAELEQVARARGQVIASARTQVVQAATDGQIVQVAVREGESVRRGQLLVQLDRAEAEAAVADSRARVAALRAALVRLESEVMGRPLVFSPEARAYPAFVENQRLLFQRRKAALESEVSALSQGLLLTREELALASGLVATGDIGRAEVLRLQKQEAELQGQINSKRSRFFQDAQEAMTKAEEDLSTQAQVLAEREVQLERMQVLAPADGLVRNIQITTPGARVRPGEVILELLPTGGQQVLEAKLPPTDIAHVRPGTRTAIKLDAFDYTVYGALSGHVTYVSPDALQERTPQGEQAYYRVLVHIDPASVAQRNQAVAPRRIQVLPGMLSTVEFVVGEHTVLQYLAKPLLKTLDESLRER